MFGNAPRLMWEKWCVPDDRGRIELACRAMLVDEGDRRVLLETGIGAFFEPALRQRYGVIEEEHVLLASLAELGFTDADIDVVVLSHLHFDHAGGLLGRYEPGEPNRLLFPRAQYLVGKRAWERAVHPHPRDHASFIPQLPALLEQSGRLRLIDDDDAAKALLGDRYSTCETSGHTPGMLHTTVRGSKQSIFFCADLVPGLPWVRSSITMGYDRYPEKLIDEKIEIFRKLHEQGTWLFFTHDADVCAARLALHEGRYIAVDKRPARDKASWDLDD